MSVEKKPKDKRRATTTAQLEAILEELMIEVAAAFPEGRYAKHPDTLRPWAHMTAMYVSELVKRKNSTADVILKKARKAVRRRVERELADTYMGMKLPSVPGRHPKTQEGLDEFDSVGGVDGLEDSVTKPEADK